MDVNLVVTPEARDDLDAAYTWYEARTSGKGEDFLASVDDCIAGILRTPEMHEISFGTSRLALIRKFPYVMIYDYEDETVTVYGVFHTSRDDKDWRKRLP